MHRAGACPQDATLEKRRYDVEITPDHLAQTHRKQFEIDQSYLPAIIEQCAAVVRVHPVRGQTGSAEK
jgi:hypothetical protein